MSKKTKRAFFSLSFKGKEKVGELEKETMKKMEEQCFTKGEAKAFALCIKESIKNNSKRMEDAIPFTVINSNIRTEKK